MLDGARFSRKSKVGAAQKTVEGCTCTSSCSRNIFRSQCDTCNTNRCGKYSATGRYGICKFPYTGGSTGWSTQMTNLWKKVSASSSTSASPPGLSAVTDSLKWSVRTTFDNYENELPAGRKKGIHSRGSVCKISWEKNWSPFTGLLAKGTVKGFMRIGLAAKGNDQGHTPGWGFMFPRSGQPAGAFVAMHSTDSGQPWNIYKNNISNHVPPASQGGTKLLAGIFEKGTKCSSMVGLSDMAMFSQTGAKSGNPKFPFKLIFVPTQAAKNSQTWGKKDINKLHQEINKVPSGTIMFNVKACKVSAASSAEASNPSVACSSPVSLGTIKLDSQCRTSQFSDSGLFFRHTRIEDDWKLMPSYKTNAQAACGRSNGDWRAASPAPCHTQRQ